MKSGDKQTPNGRKKQDACPSWWWSWFWQPSAPHSETAAESRRQLLRSPCPRRRYLPAEDASDPAETVPSSEAEAPVDDSVPTEYRSALASAESYSELMHMSKAGIYDQLTSEYGEQFSPEAAQYAIDNMQADWNENALQTAQNYSDQMHMSKAGIYDQLISEYGEQFTESEAQYAVDHVQADWNQNALETARSYQETMNMSPSAIWDQLVSEYGEQFTESEADYAIANLG